MYNAAMITTSSSDLRKNLSAMLDRVTSDHEPMVITRDKGKPSVVLMSLEDFAAYEETRYLLRSPANADRLLTSISELDQGRGSERKLAE
jgi:antitoxin YefM